MLGYSVDVRERIVRAVQSGMSVLDAARTFGVGHATVERYTRLHRQGQPLVGQPNTGSPPRVLLPEQYGALLAQLKTNPDLTTAEHAAIWRAAHGPISTSTMARRIRALKWTRKKTTSVKLACRAGPRRRRIVGGQRCGPVEPSRPIEASGFKGS